MFSFWNNFSPPPHLSVFFIKSHFHKFYPQSKTFLNIRAVLSNAAFCSNAVLITTSSFTMHFSSFFDVLPSASTTTGMTLMLLVFYILLIFLFSSWYLSIFFFSLSLTLMSPGIAISIMVQLLSLLFATTISGFLALISVTLDHNIPQNLNSFIFNNTFWSMFTPFLTSFQVESPTQFPMNYSCNIIVPSLVLFAFSHNMRYGFTFLSHILQSGYWAFLSILRFT